MSEETPVDFGTMFRQARERRGVSLQQVAAVTKISARVLDALERNDVSKLPGGIFSRAFVRSYAVEVGLDPEMAIERFTVEFPGESGKEQTPSAEEAHDIAAYESGRRVATTVLQLVGLSIVVIAVLVYALNARACRAPAAATQAKPAAVASTPAPVPPPSPAVESSPSAEEPAPVAAETPAAAPPPAVVPAPAQQTPGGESSSPAQTAAPLQLAIVAQSDCWLMVKVDKAVVFSRVLVAGERLAYQASASVTLVAGNAGGLRLTINGKPARPIGTPGEVVTTTITPETIGSFLQ